MAETTPTQEQVIQLVIEYFNNKKNTILNLSDFVEKNNPKPYMGLEYHLAKSMAATLKASGKFEIETAEAIFFVKRVVRKKFNERQPLIFAILMAFIGAVFALTGRWLTEKIGGQAQHQLDKQQDSLIQNLSDSLTNLHKQLADSIAILKREIGD